ncbi:MAG: hypothetical protein QOJ34_1117 [Pseudonocardiales bacterium]|jgi:hypothetical protein|nr:hypothetical protein [Pseudonocardiales bacterium]
MDLTPTIIQVLFTAALARADSGVRWVRGRVGPDHHTIWAGHYPSGSDRNDRAFVVVRCGPDRPCSFAEPDLDVARAFAAIALAGRVPPLPTVFRDGLHLVDDAPAGLHGPHCWIWRYGLIELVLPVGLPVEDGRPFTIPVGEVAEAVLLLATAVRDGWYRQLFAGSRRVRLDWTLAVTQHVGTDTGMHAWEALTFPGREPRDRGHRASPAAPTGHLIDALRSQRQRRDPSDIAVAAVGEFVHAAAYRGCREAVDDSVRVGAARIATSRRLDLLVPATPHDG